MALGHNKSFVHCFNESLLAVVVVASSANRKEHDKLWYAVKVRLQNCIAMYFAHFSKKVCIVSFKHCFCLVKELMNL